MYVLLKKSLLYVCKQHWHNLLRNIIFHMVIHTLSPDCSTSWSSLCRCSCVLASACCWLSPPTHPSFWFLHLQISASHLHTTSSAAACLLSTTLVLTVMLLVGCLICSRETLWHQWDGWRWSLLVTADSRSTNNTHYLCCQRYGFLASSG